MLAADADAWTFLGAVSDDFKVVFSCLWVSHADYVPAEVVAFVGPKCWAKAACGHPVWAFCSHVVITEDCDVSVHFWVYYTDDAGFGFLSVEIVIDAFNRLW